MRNWLVLIAVVGIFTGTAGAGTVYSNLATTSPAFQSGGWAVLGANSFSGFFPFERPAFAFTAGGDYRFSELDVAVTLLGGTNAITVDLMTDSGNLPGAALESWSVTGLPLFDPSSCCSLEKLSDAAGTSAGPITLSAGSQYWVAVGPGGDDTFAIWNFNNIGAGGLGSSDTGNGFTFSNTLSPISAFAVQGTPAPEEDTWQYLALALVSAFLLRSRLRTLAQPVVHEPRQRGERD
jgi:hypothetical protein